MTETFANLSDPIRAPQFYASVPSKRLYAGVLDSVFTIAITLAFPSTAFISMFFSCPSPDHRLCLSQSDDSVLIYNLGACV